MSARLRSLQGLALLAGVLCTATTAAATIVQDNDFVGGVYEFRYDTWNNQVLVNGTATGASFGTLFLTNAGNTPHAAWEREFGSGLWYLRAPGQYDGWGGGLNSTWNTSAAATMGWDFSGLTGRIASIEMMGSNAVFQFSPWGDEAAGDRISADVATPASFGTGSYSNLWSFVSNNPGNSSGAPSALGSGGLIDITGSLNASWLSDPNLLEFRFGYQLVNTDIPSRHLQLFRDSSSGIGPTYDGFRLRVTLAQESIPEPSTLAMFLGLVGLTLIKAYRRRKRTA